MYFHFETLKTYTGSLLSLFGNLETQVKHSNGKTHISRVPIQYSNREKSDIINQLEYNQIFSGNSQILPRAILLFTGMSAARDREKNKFSKIAQINLNGQKRQYQFNSVPYNFEFQVLVQTRGMSEACQIIEQVCSYFNPSYNMKIRELPFKEIEPTSIKLELTNTAIEQQDIDEYSINVVTISFDLTLSGNLYPAVKDQELVKHLQIFVSTGENPERASSISNTEDEQILNQYEAKITDVISEDNKLTAKISSKCEKLIKFKCEWEINGQQIPNDSQSIIYQISAGDIVRVRAYTDITSSDYFEKTFEISDINYKINVSDIVYSNGELEVNFSDLIPKDVHYTYNWWIDGQLLNYKNKIIKYELNQRTNECIPLRDIRVRVNSNDGRQSEIFEKYM